MKMSGTSYKCSDTFHSPLCGKPDFVLYSVILQLYEIVGITTH
jgi:hypothetical protein